MVLLSVFIPLYAEECDTAVDGDACAVVVSVVVGSVVVVREVGSVVCLLVLVVKTEVCSVVD